MICFYAQTEENVQLAECTALAAFQGHRHCFPGVAGISTLTRKRPTTDMILKLLSV